MLLLEWFTHDGVSRMIQDYYKLSKGVIACLPVLPFYDASYFDVSFCAAIDQTSAIFYVENFILFSASLICGPFWGHYARAPPTYK